tara:strand:- start:13621 stop:14934 length:1314 start_codon:yes stop_codon:yes gene_type:complete
MNKCKIGIVGFGTVGKGIYKILKNTQNNHPILQEIEIVNIVVKDLNKKREFKLENGLLIDDPNLLINNPTIDVIVEVMGGTDLAKEIILKSLDAGKSVVTANKAVMARYGEEIYSKASSKGVYILFEAAVCGGIPIIEPIKRSLKSNQIKKMTGIINGTTNFILSRMSEGKDSYEDSLKLAQKLGYAELDPSSDVQGQDAADKISILTELAFGGKINRNKIDTRGIDKINLKDISYANKLGFQIKLLAVSEKMSISSEESLPLNTWVGPTLIHKSHPLASVKGVNNAILVEGDPIGEIMLYGPGAGSGPTAASVVSDLLNLKSISFKNNINEKSNIDSLLAFDFWRKCHLVPPDNVIKKIYLRIICKDSPGVIGKIGQIFGENNVSIESIVQLDARENEAEIVVITHEVPNGNINSSKDQLNGLSEVKLIASQLNCI